jgi:hypothetical protein
MGLYNRQSSAKRRASELVTSGRSLYLGVTINKNLRWDDHINNITARTNRTLGFLKRNLRGCKTSARARAYEAIVPPTLEYTASIFPDGSWEKGVSVDILPGWRNLEGIRHLTWSLMEQDMLPAKRKRTNSQLFTEAYTEIRNPTKNRRWTQVFWNDRQFLFH